MICGAIQNLIVYGIKYRLITNADELVVRNELMDALRLTDWKDGVPAEECETIDEILQPLVDYACKQGIITDTVNSRDLFDTKLMGCLTPMPREIIAEF